MKLHTGVYLHERHLKKYQLPGDIHEPKLEGYDGHLEWDPTSNKNLVLMWHFHQAVKAGDRNYVMDTLEHLGAASTKPQLSHIAGLIISKSAEDLKEALLSVICIGSRPLTEFILVLFVDHPHEERSGCTDSDAFPPHMTPLVLACIMNNFAIVECLLLRNHSIQAPHHKNCKCEFCIRMPYAALASLQKVDTLRALCSEAFLWLATDDPFAAACAMALDLEQFIRDDNSEFTVSFRSLQQNVQRFAARMVDQNWSEHELDLFLSHKCHSPLSVCENPHPRVQLALDSGMKDMIASTNVQRTMDEIWWRGWGNFGANSKRDLYRLMRHVVFYPILALLYIFTNEKLGKSFDVPLARYISNLSSYLGFLFCLIVIRSMKVGGLPPTGSQKSFLLGLESYCYLYILGMLSERYLLFTRHGFRNYFQFWWRWFDFMLIGVFMLAIHLWLTELMDPVDVVLHQTHRKHWPSFDYFSLYNIYVGTGCMLAIWKIFYYFQLLKGLGSSVISVGKCVSSVYYYLIIMAVIMFSFAVGLNLIVQPYMDNFQQTEDGVQRMRDHLGSLSYTYRNLYWAFYGYLDPQLVPIVVGNAGPDHTPTYHNLTSYATEALLALYHVIIIITLLNLMISLLVKKADEVLDNEELEFKYTRVVIFTEYIHWSSAVPPPFNLILIIKEMIVRRFSTKYVWSWPEVVIEREIIDPYPGTACRECTAYESLLLTAFKRFRSSKEYHYTTIFRTEFDSKDKPNQAAAKVAFMNGEDASEKKRHSAASTTGSKLSTVNTDLPKSNRTQPK